MRLSGEWIYRKQGWNRLPHDLKDTTWLRIGFGVADYGGLLFLVALVLGGVAVRRLRSGKSGTKLLYLCTVPGQSAAGMKAHPDGQVVPDWMSRSHPLIHAHA